nr:MAG TPA: hypothetical protein [Caudoviricetes sp.]
MLDELSGFRSCRETTPGLDNTTISSLLINSMINLLQLPICRAVDYPIKSIIPQSKK